jgi:hypothetical protein
MEIPYINVDYLVNWEKPNINIQLEFAAAEAIILKSGRKPYRQLTSGGRIVYKRPGVYSFISKNTINS